MSTGVLHTTGCGRTSRGHVLMTGRMLTHDRQLQVALWRQWRGTGTSRHDCNIETFVR
jgi:hypothetical protein